MKASEKNNNNNNNKSKMLFLPKVTLNMEL